MYGINVGPPTKIIFSTAVFLIPAVFNVSFESLIVLSINGLINASNSFREKSIKKWLFSN